MDLQTKNRLLQQAYEDYRKNVDAIERVWVLTKSNGSPVERSPVKEQEQEESTKFVTVSYDQDVNKSAVIKEAIRKANDRFTNKDIKQIINILHPELGIETNEISTIFYALANTKKPKIVKTGEGNQRSGYIYEKKVANSKI